MEHVAVKLRIQFRLQDLVEHRQLGLFLGLERAGILEHLAVAIAQDVGRKPSRHPEHARLQPRRDQRLHKRLAGLEVLAADREIGLARELQQRRRVGGQVGRAVGVRNSHLERGVSVDLARRDIGIVVREPGLEGFQRLMHRRRPMEDLGRAAPDHHGARDAGALLEIAGCRPSASRPCPSWCALPSHWGREYCARSPGRKRHPSDEVFPAARAPAPAAGDRAPRR